MKKFVGILLATALLAGAALAQDASAMQIYKAAKLARQTEPAPAAQQIKHKKGAAKKHRIRRARRAKGKVHRAHRLHHRAHKKATS